jgi:outer membrane lipoprotein LolB
VLGALVAGCATPPPPPPVEGPRFSGRLAVNVPPFEGQAARSFSAQFELQGTGDRGELQLSTPLGSTLARARWQPEGAEVMTPDGISRYPDLGAMTRALVGETLPMAALIDWLQGRPWPGARSAATDTGFSQLGWSVRLPKGDEQPLLVAAREEPPQVQVRVRLDR